MCPCQLPPGFSRPRKARFRGCRRTSAGAQVSLTCAGAQVFLALVADAQNVSNQGAGAVALPRITERQAQALRFCVVFFRQNGVPASLRALAKDGLGLSSKATNPSHYVAPLLDLGYLARRVVGGRRDIVPTPLAFAWLDRKDSILSTQTETGALFVECDGQAKLTLRKHSESLARRRRRTAKRRSLLLEAFRPGQLGAGPMPILEGKRGI